MSARPFVRRRLESFKEHFWKIAQPSVKKPITASEPSVVCSERVKRRERERVVVVLGLCAG